MIIGGQIMNHDYVFNCVLVTKKREPEKIGQATIPSSKDRDLSAEREVVAQTQSHQTPYLKPNRGFRAEA